MPHCEGGGQIIFGFPKQGACGSADVHGEHDFKAGEKICLGSPMSLIEADCGNVGPHDEHPINQPPVMTDESDD